MRQAGGLAVPVSAGTRNRSLSRKRLQGAGSIAVARFNLQSDSGGATLHSITAAASGSGDDTLIDNVMLVVDSNGDGKLSGSDVILASGKYPVDNGTITFPLAEPYDVPPGVTELIIVYELLEKGDP